MASLETVRPVGEVWVSRCHGTASPASVLVEARSVRITASLVSGVPRPFRPGPAHRGDARSCSLCSFLATRGTQGSPTPSSRRTSVVPLSTAGHASHGSLRHPREARGVWSAETGADPLLPPWPDAFHGEGSRLMIHASLDPTGGVSQVVHPEGRGSPMARDGNIRHPHLLGFACGTPCSSRMLAIASPFLLRGIHGDRRIPCGQKRLHLGMEMLERRMAVRLRASLARRAVACTREPAAGSPSLTR